MNEVTAVSCTHGWSGRGGREGADTGCQGERRHGQRWRDQVHRKEASSNATDRKKVQATSGFIDFTPRYTSCVEGARTHARTHRNVRGKWDAATVRSHGAESV